jgi:8-oxo-dGTP pyrophosphatase MutT (NUDIX family)
MPESRVSPSDATGGKPNSTARPIRPAATLVPIRQASDGIEVLMVRRADTMRFLPGHLAFPGGAVSQVDERLQRCFSAGVPAGSEAADDTLFAAAAIRETAEEIGWVCAVSGSGGPLHDVGLSSGDRQQLWENEDALPALLARNRWKLDLSRLRFVGRWVTPPSQPARFDTRFFVYESEGITEPQVHGSELAWAGWCNPLSMLAAVESGRERAVPPTVAMLRALTAFASARDAMAAMHVPGPAPRP